VPLNVRRLLSTPGIPHVLLQHIALAILAVPDLDDVLSLARLEVMIDGHRGGEGGKDE